MRGLKPESLTYEEEIASEIVRGTWEGCWMGGLVYEKGTSGFPNPALDYHPWMGDYYHGGGLWKSHTEALLLPVPLLCGRIDRRGSFRARPPN